MTLFVDSFDLLMYALKLGIFVVDGAEPLLCPKGLSKLVGSWAVVVPVVASRLCESGVEAVKEGATSRDVAAGFERVYRVQLLAAVDAACTTGRMTRD